MPDFDVSVRSRGLAGRSLRKAVFLLSASALMLPVCAQAVSAADLEEIIVSARKRSESIREIPDTIKAFTSDMIEDADLKSANDLPRLTTNFSLIEAQQPGVVLINIRGIAQVRNGEAPIALVVDGVQSNVANQITQALFDVEQMEVLKGPQGALYGRNAIGGAINIVTKRPTDTFEGYAKLGYGSGDTWRVEAAMGGPLVEDKVAFRLAGMYRDRQGQIDNVTTGEKVDFDETWGLRGTLDFQVSDVFSLSVRGTLLDTKGGASYYVPIPVGLSNSDPQPVIQNRDGYGDREINEVSFNATWEAGFADITLIGSYSDLYSYLDEELDWLPQDLLVATQELDNKAWSTELRFASPDDGGAFSWLFGLYYLNVKRDLDTVIYGHPDLTGLPDPIPLTPTRSSDNNDSYAVFGQAEYDFSDALRLTVGLRYDYEDRHQVDRVTPGSYSKSFESVQPKVSLTYDVSSDFLTYLTVGKGFRSGGFNSNSAVTRQYDSETLWSYELGARSSWADNRVNANVALFYMDLSDRQVYGLDLTTSPAQFIANPVRDAHVKGVEIELAARPTENLELTAGLGLMDSEIDAYDTALLSGTLANGDFTGNKLNQAPTYSYNVAVQHTLPFSNGLSLVSRVEAYGSGGDYYWEIDNRDKREAQTFVDMRLTLVSEGLGELAFYAKNLFKEKYNVEFVPVEWSAAVPGDLGLPGTPRQFGVEAKVTF